MEDKAKEFIKTLMWYMAEEDELTKMYVEARNELNKQFNERIRKCKSDETSYS